MKIIIFSKAKPQQTSPGSLLLHGTLLCETYQQSANLQTKNPNIFTSTYDHSLMLVLSSYPVTSVLSSPKRRVPSHPEDQAKREQGAPGTLHPLKTAGSSVFPPFGSLSSPSCRHTPVGYCLGLEGRTAAPAKETSCPHPAQSHSLPALVSLGGAGDHWRPRVAGSGGSSLLQCRGEQLKWAETPDSFG